MSPEAKRHQRYALGAAVVLLAAALHEAIRVVADLPWGGIAPVHSNIASSFHAILWTATASTLLLRHRRKGLATLAWVFSFMAPLAMVPHAMVTRLGGSWEGLLYLPVAGALVLLLKRAWDGDELRAQRHESLIARYEDALLVDPVTGRAGHRA